MLLYNAIVDGLKKNIPPHAGIEDYLESLQKPVKELRLAYRNSPVYVSYEKKEIQAAYLTTYLPHYYQLIYKILIEDVPDIFQDKENIYLTFIGGGPGSEAYGTIKYVVNNCPLAKHIHVTILDINASTWGFSHKIVNDSLIESFTRDKIIVHWNAINFDLTSLVEIKKNQSLIQKTDLLVIQNCLNEIANTNLPALRDGLNCLFDFLPGNSYLLMSDLTSGARNTIKALEKLLVEKFHPKFLKSTLAFSEPISLISVHHRPSPIISRHLLNGSDGLIPRKYLKYDFSLLSKGVIEKVVDHKALGFSAIYRPLDFKKLDANDFIHKKIFIGLDFGTSSTVVSAAQLVNGRIKIITIPIKQKDHLGSSSTSPLVPSVIALVNGNRLIVGIHAADHKPYLEYGKNCWHSFKQLLDKLDEVSYPTSQLANNSKFQIGNARDALTLFLKYIKEQIFDYLGNKSLPMEVEYSISVPAAFSSKEKKALKTCLLDAGIECEDTPFMEEPNAALINYLFEENIDTTGNETKNILVLDLGAGTVDVSVLFVENGAEGLSSKLLSVVRLGNIGGNVIDELLANEILKKQNFTTKGNEALKVEMSSICEQLKIKICKNIITDKSVNFYLPDKSKSDVVEKIEPTSSLRASGVNSVELSYNEFNSVMKHYWSGSDERHGVKGTIEKALNNSQLSADLIDKVIVSGGGGRNPYIKHLVASFFAKSEIIIPDNIQEQVARGVALQSFVLNSFGKNIITPLLSRNMYVAGENKTVKLFSTGDSIPTIDVEVYLSEVLSMEKRYVASYEGESKSSGKFFLIPENLKIEKLIFYITPDQELKCDIIGSTYVKEAAEAYENPKGELVTLK